MNAAQCAVDSYAATTGEFRVCPLADIPLADPAVGTMAVVPVLGGGETLR